MPTQRLIQVLFDELPQQPQEQLQLPVSGHPKIRQMVETMAQEPARWNTLGQWASVFAMSERNLARLVVKETGLSFRRWRHQLQLITALQALIAGRNVQQTAQMLGYDSTTAFITMFKKAGADAGQYLTGELLLPTIKETSPAAISGPTGTPRNSATPSTVPTSSPATSCGWFPISVMPRPPSRRRKRRRQSRPAISSSQKSGSMWRAVGFRWRWGPSRRWSE